MLEKHHLSSWWPKVMYEEASLDSLSKLMEVEAKEPGCKLSAIPRGMHLGQRMTNDPVEE